MSDKKGGSLQKNEETKAPIAKVLTQDDFIQVCKELSELAIYETSIVSQKNECKQKIEVYIRKQITKYITDKKEHDKFHQPTAQTLLEFLMLMDKELPWQEFYKEHGHDLFPMFFKLTLYGEDIKYSVYNTAPVLDYKGKIEEHDNLCWKLGDIRKTESQINFIINQLLLKQLEAVEDKFQMLCNVAELMHSGAFKSTKTIGKSMMYFAKMYSQIEKDPDAKAFSVGANCDRHKFLMGSLYALGGMLKIEAKSYLMTLNEKYTKDPEKNTQKFKLVCQLSNPENPLEEREKIHIRHLDEGDLQFFQDSFYLVVIEFMKAISEGLHKTINNSTFNLLLDLTNENFYDEMVELGKNQPHKLDAVLSSHFVTKFSLDVLQFSFAYFVDAESVNQEQPDKRQLYDHRKPIDLMLDGNQTALLNIRYILPNFEQLMVTLIGVLDQIWTNKFNILKLWCIKYAEDPEKARDLDSEKDCYERLDNYDGQGVAIFTYLNLKPQIDCVFQNESKENLISDSQDFLQYQTYGFLFEASMPAINFLIQNSISHPVSTTLKQMGLELSTFLLFMQQQENQVYDGFGYHTKDTSSILQYTSNLFQIMGDRNQEYLLPQNQKLCMRLIFSTLKPYNSDSDIVNLFESLLKYDETIKSDDMAQSVLINNFIKPFLMDRVDKDCESNIYIDFVIDKVFPITVDVLMEDAPHINEMSQRIQSSLNLYINMKSKFTNNQKMKELQQTFFKKYIDSMTKVIKATEDTMAKESKEESGQLDNELNVMNQSADQIKSYQLVMIKDLLAVIEK